MFTNNCFQLVEHIEFFLGTTPDQHIDRAHALTLKQFDNQVLADEAGATGNEIVHRAGPFLSEAWFEFVS